MSSNVTSENRFSAAARPALTRHDGSNAEDETRVRSRPTAVQAEATAADWHWHNTGRDDFETHRLYSAKTHFIY